MRILFITETVPLALLSIQRRLDLIDIEEFGDLSHRPSPHMVMEQMRFGKPLDEFDPDRRKNHLFGEYQLNDNAILNVNIDNLFDKEYRQYLDLENSPGFSARVGLTMRLGVQ